MEDVFNRVLPSNRIYVLYFHMLKIFFYPILEILDPDPLVKNLNCDFRTRYLPF